MPLSFAHQKRLHPIPYLHWNLQPILLLHRYIPQINALMILSTRRISMIMLTLFALILDLKHALQLPTRNHVLLSRTRRLSQRIRRLVPSVRNARYL